jgi:VWFA-related protein
MSLRTMVLAFGFLSLAAVADAQLNWLPLDDALKSAQASGRLILLDLHYGASDKRGDKWIDDARKNSGVAKAMEQMVLAVQTTVPNGEAFKDLEQFRGSKRHLLVLDPRGGVVMELDDAFGNVDKFSLALNALRQQTPTFIRAAEQRRAGMYARSTLTWGNGLLDAGFIDDATSVFKGAIETAKHDNDTEASQGARLGLASANVRGTNTIDQAFHDLQDLAAHGVTTEIQSSAWLLLGYIYRERQDAKRAIDAYQHSFAAAPKPSSLAEAARRHLDALGSEPETEVRADVAAGNIHLLFPHRSVLVGKMEFGVATSDDVSRVDLFLDDTRVAELTRRPFRARLNLGATPHVHTLRAVAWDAQERQLGVETVTLNDRAVSLGISIVAPREDRVTSRTTVEVKPRVPEGSRLAGVDLYWNDTKLATLTAAPFLYELTLPSPSAAGFIRAVARDDSGGTAEDAKLLNAAGSVAQVGVDAVQVYAIVQEHGRYVEGLKSSDFVVKEDGLTVSAQVQSGSADPISIGLALDTSASMRASMADVADYANEFVKESLGPADQTFVVAFDEQPRLLQPLTSDRGRVIASIDDVHASGGTAIYDAILYSLQQFRGVGGKRALVVFTDGFNNGGIATPDGVLQFAREIGVPLYVVQVFSWPAFSLEERMLNRIADATGGAYFSTARKVDLPRIFAQIRDDTRGEYLLTYVSPADKSRREMRRISVEVPGRRVSVRATSAYYPK